LAKFTFYDDPFQDYDTEPPVVSVVEPVMMYANG